MSAGPKGMAVLSVMRRLMTSATTTSAKSIVATRKPMHEQRQAGHQPEAHRELQVAPPERPWKRRSLMARRAGATMAAATALTTPSSCRPGAG